ncbi:MAG TPA: GntR family transcriptional regulator [Clostridiales bacterium]|nr:GntR family transcriptional regulator [Clostridiales bacterium]
MPVEFTSDMPIYLQLIRLVRQGVASGELVPGSRLPGVREMAIEYGVNPNTVQRALVKLERDGLLYTERTAGRFVTADAARIAAVRGELADRQIDDFVRQMKSLGYNCRQLLETLEKKWSDHNGDD